MKITKQILVAIPMLVLGTLASADNYQLSTCFICHGTAGQSYNPNFPKLAAQPAPYLVNQMNAFHTHSRADADAVNYMWGMAAQLNAADIQAIANYFAAQAPGPQNSPGDAAKIASGKSLYSAGIPAIGVPACAACHGANGQGLATFPRLAGQFKSYLTKQLHAFKDGSRADDPTMPMFTKNMTEQEIDDLTEYLESL